MRIIFVLEVIESTVKNAANHAYILLLFHTNTFDTKHKQIA